MSAEKALSQEALEVLGSLQVDGNVVRIPERWGQLDRKLYKEVDAALGTIGAAWNRKARGHVLAGELDIQEALDAIIHTGVLVDRKKLLQFYETPPEVAELVVAHADLHDGEQVLEPSAGRGALVRAVLAVAKVEVTAVELDEHHLSELEKSGAQHVRCADFTQWAGAAFDKVVMNPPFTKQQDALHVMSAFGMLRPGGRLVSVMSAGVKFRDTAHYRWVRKLARKIIDLPPGSFKASGTSVNTVIVVCDAK